MSALTRTSLRGQAGITLTEVLVVTLIIGILAAIALPAFASQRDKAGSAAAKANARTARTAIETVYTERQTYAVAPADLVELEPALAEARNLRATGTDSSFEVSVEDRRGDTWGIRLASGAIERFCAPAGVRSCPASGRW